MLSDENNWKLRRERKSIKSIKVKWGHRWRRENDKSLLIKYLYLYWRKKWYKKYHCYVTSSLLSVSNNIWCQRGNAKIISSFIAPPKISLGAFWLHSYIFKILLMFRYSHNSIFLHVCIGICPGAGVSLTAALFLFLLLSKSLQIWCRWENKDNGPTFLNVAPHYLSYIF